MRPTHSLCGARRLQHAPACITKQASRPVTEWAGDTQYHKWCVLHSEARPLPPPPISSWRTHPISAQHGHFAIPAASTAQHSTASKRQPCTLPSMSEVHTLAAADTCMAPAGSAKAKGYALSSVLLLAMGEGRHGMALVQAGVVARLVAVARDEADQHLVEYAAAVLGQLSRSFQAQVGGWLGA
jgi:hypothetical protein